MKSKQIAKAICMEDVKIIPFQELAKLIDHYPKGHKYRTCVLWLALTGARVCEIEHRSFDEIMGKYWIWKPRKKQRGVRKEKLPDWFWEEFQRYLDTHAYKRKDVFGIKARSLSRKINNVRDDLGGEWKTMVPVFGEGRGGVVRWEHLYKLKNLRHNYVTLEHYKLSEKYGGDVAVSLLARRMRHSTHHLTASHYIEKYDALGAEKYSNSTIAEIMSQSVNQHKITEWF